MSTPCVEISFSKLRNCYKRLGVQRETSVCVLGQACHTCVLPSQSPKPRGLVPEIKKKKKRNFAVVMTLLIFKWEEDPVSAGPMESQCPLKREVGWVESEIEIVGFEDGGATCQGMQATPENQLAETASPPRAALTLAP